MKIVKVGVIGVGIMGLHHARNFSEIDGVDLVAVSDISKEKGEKVAQKYHSRYFQDYHSILKDPNISAVSIAVPTSLHFKIAKDCLSAGKHVLVEKPITDKSIDARKLILTAKKYNLIFGVGHTERFNPAISMLKKHIANQELGKIVSLSAQRVGLYPANAKDTDVIIDLAIHDIDIFTYLLDQLPQKIYCVGGRALGRGREDFAQVLLSYQGPIQGVIQVNWITPVKIRQLAVTGTHGYIELDYMTQKLRIYKSHPEENFSTFGEFLVKFGTPDVTDVNVKGEEPLRVELRTFTDCVRSGREFPVGGDIGLSALLIAEKAILSLRGSHG